ncbi:uncharacterized protein EI90DRAFT_1618068 [Cantharellus anzutake]|uniref:uncharacterized protein n=1 Tax=Cantharellus anzutake TaxID=1750568 RepID=UPI001903A1F0|nr:uncharacterized protein EI90DRAFT_1618068 [Cantharellus anzutake]KAF8328222.1 hypothetical protein EI90DRAFT_1618068 [Cantharellus anzutake]
MVIPQTIPVAHRLRLWLRIRSLAFGARCLRNVQHHLPLPLMLMRHPGQLEAIKSPKLTRASPPITSPLAEAREAQDFARADQSQETDPLQVPLPTSPPPEVDSPTPIAPVAPIPVPADPLTPSLAAAELHSPCPRPHSQLQSIIPLSSLAEYPTSSSPTQWSTGNTSDQLYGASFQADGMAPKPSDIVESVPSEGGEISTEPVESMVALLESSDQIQTELHDGTSSNLTDDRLQVVEKRFSDMASSFKRLQAERHAADKLLKSFSPSLAISDLTGLAAFLANLMSAADDAAADIRELTEKLRIQAERMEELRDTHSLEGISRSEQVDLLQRQQKEAEALLAASQSAAAGSIAELETLRKKGRDDLAAVQGELEKARKMIKEEEEKRVKAISLLKTVRTKLVNTEKELEEANQERTRLKEDGIKLRDKEKSERERLEAEIQKLKDEKAKESARLWTQFEADLANQRLKMEKEMSAKQSQLELQIINLKNCPRKMSRYRN